LINLFCPSLIEVSEGIDFNSFSQKLVTAGFKVFHIDVGDNKFIKRQICGLNKIRALHDLNSGIKVNVHLMVEEPHLNKAPNSSLDYINCYVNAGCDRIGVHLRSFASRQSCEDCLMKIVGNGKEPGIVIETTEPFDAKIKSLILKHDLKWIVLMGVPVGRGGQMFDQKVLEKISLVRQFSEQNDHHLDVEVDGGLSLEILEACLKSGANLFSGWSVINPDKSTDLSEKVALVEGLLRIDRGSLTQEHA
jgi:ribulose-phosphate 3-epimerase